MSDKIVEMSETAIEASEAVGEASKTAIEASGAAVEASKTAPIESLHELIPEEVRNVAAEGAFTVLRAPGKLPATGFSHDSLGLNATWALELGLRNGQHVAVVDAARGKRADCHVRFSAKAAPGQALLAVKLREALGMGVDDLDELVVTPLVGVGYDKVGLQSLENVTDNRIYLPKRDFALIDRRYAYYLLGCLETGCTLPVRTEDIVCVADD